MQLFSFQQNLLIFYLTKGEKIISFDFFEIQMNVCGFDLKYGINKIIPFNFVVLIHNLFKVQFVAKHVGDCITAIAKEYVNKEKKEINARNTI